MNAAENRLSTHEVVNQPYALADYNLFEADAALTSRVREAAPWALDDLSRFGALAGTADYLELGALANRHPPEFDTHDRYGRRVDLVRFHPAYHELMRVAVAEGIAASPWDQPRPGAHVARAAGMDKGARARREPLRRHCARFVYSQYRP